MSDPWNLLPDGVKLFLLYVAATGAFIAAEKLFWVLATLPTLKALKKTQRALRRYLRERSIRGKTMSEAIGTRIAGTVAVVGATIFLLAFAAFLVWMFMHRMTPTEPTPREDQQAERFSLHDTRNKSPSPGLPEGGRVRF